MRFGLVGTGRWATTAHGPGLLAAEQAELIGIWGRNAQRRGALARSLGVKDYATYEALLRDADAISFAVTPDVQARLALLATNAGKHVLLEKPVATSVSAAQRLVDAIESAGVASLVHFTDYFSPVGHRWLEDKGADAGWHGGWGRWFNAHHERHGGQSEPSWRFERGALWDVGPHAIFVMTAALGPIERIKALGGELDLVHLLFEHSSGASSTVSVCSFVPAPAAGRVVSVWGDKGISTLPAHNDPAVSLGRAASDLIRVKLSGRPHTLDARFGARVVSLLAEAEEQVRAAKHR